MPETGHGCGVTRSDEIHRVARFDACRDADPLTLTAAVVTRPQCAVAREPTLMFRNRRSFVHLSHAITSDGYMTPPDSLVLAP